MSASPCEDNPQIEEASAEQQVCKSKQISQMAVSMRASKKVPVSARHTYAGLKILPPDAYEKLQVYSREKKCIETHFRCKYVSSASRGGPGKACGRQFVKSTSLIVHFQRHINLRPFVCPFCKMSFTQSGTLVRHYRSKHTSDARDEE